MTWFLIWIIAYLVVIIVLTLRHVNVKNVDSYLINSRSTRTIPLVFTTMATFVGGGTSMGLIAFGYESGFAAVAIGLAYVIGFFILARFAPLIHREGVLKSIYSFPEYLNKRYLIDCKSSWFPRLFSSTVSCINIFIFFFLLAAQFVGMASLLEYSFEIGYQYAAVISCLIVIGYTAFAGLSGVIVTDNLQFIIILVMIAFVFIPGISSDTEGFARLKELDVRFLNGSAEGYLFLFAVPVFLCWSVIVRMDIWQRIFAARSEKVAKRTSIIAGLSMLPFYVLFPLVGMAVKLVNTGTPLDNAKDATYFFISSHCNEVFLGFAVIGLLSALMSSGDSFLNIISITAVKDFVGWSKQKASKKQIHQRVRLMVVIFGVVAMLLAMNLPDIVDLMVVGVSTIGIFVPITLLALLKKDVTKNRLTAFSSLGAAFIVNVFFFIFGQIAPDKFSSKSSFIPAMVVGVLVMIIGLLVDKRRVKE